MDTKANLPDADPVCTFITDITPTSEEPLNCPMVQLLGALSGKWAFLVSTDYFRCPDTVW